MAIVTRFFVEKGPSNGQLERYVDPSVISLERFKTPVVIVQYDDAIPGTTLTLDEYMDNVGYDPSAGDDIAFAFMARPGDPGTVVGRATAYSKTIAGVAQLFVRSDDGAVHQLTPPGINGIIYGAGDPNGFQSAPVNRLYVDTLSGQFYQNYDGATAWALVTTGIATPWDNTKTYQRFSSVARGPYAWRSLGVTSEDPLEFGSLASPAQWLMNTTGGSGALQANGEMLLIDSVNGMSTAAFHQMAAPHNGFLGKMLVMDICMFGTPGLMADSFMFGVYDAAGAQVANNLFGLGGFYGAEIDIFNSRITNFVNGAQDANFAYSNANSINAGQQYQRWLMKMDANGANWDLSFYRVSRVSATGYSNQNSNSIDDFQLIGQLLNKARPAYANWIPVIGARTGGFNALFKCKFVGVRNMSSGAWAPLSQLPTNLG